MLLRRGARGHGQLVAVSPNTSDWNHIWFSAHRLPQGAEVRGDTRERETALIALGGRFSLEAGAKTFEAVGTREDVWERRPPALVLLPPGTTYTLRAETDLHLAVAGAEAQEGGGPRLIGPEEIASEERGEGRTLRHIHHLLPPSAPATRLILVEVYTPAGNWSSFPPHKHDVEDPPREALLEETYYFGIDPPTGFALQRVYSDDRTLDETLAPGDGDLVLVPRGYHVVSASPGHECYYLNVMAGPGRAWNFTVDPDYAHLMNWRR